MPEPQHAPGTFCWFECGSTDVARAKAFYTRVFGWDAFDVPMPGGAGFYTLFRRDGEDIAGLYELAGPQFAGVPSNWATYVAVTDVDATIGRVASLGGRTILEPMDIPNVGRFAFLQDPTGAAIGVARFDAHPGMSKRGPFGWSELATRDTARAAEFYAALFDWRAKLDEKHSYTEFQVGGRSIGGMMPMGPHHGNAPAYWLPYVAVEDCDALLVEANAAGAHALMPPMTIEHVGRFAVIADPAGAALAVIRLFHD